MYICDYCGEHCNSITNVFITLNLCPDCYKKWQHGKLGKDKEPEEKPEEPEKE